MSAAERASASSATSAPGRGARVCWALYDWAHSSYSAIVSTFVFPAYFASRVAADETAGTTQWGNTLGIAGAIVALGAPLLGAIADQSGRLHAARRAGHGVAVVGAAAAGRRAAGAADVRPRHRSRRNGGRLLQRDAALAHHRRAARPLVGLGLGPRLCRRHWLPAAGPVRLRSPRRLAGAAARRSQHVRATFVLVAAWYALFALPLLLFTPDEHGCERPLARALRDGLAQLRDSMRQARRHIALLRFLLARMVFIDGLATIFAFGGVYAAGTFDMNEQQVLGFGIALNVAAGIGAAAFAWVDDWIGPRRTILIALAGLIVPATLLLLVESRSLFWLLGLALGVFVGPVQAAGRSYLAHAAPERLRNQMFGLFAFSGKATAFAGPLLVGWVTTMFDSQRAGMSVIVLLLAAGFVLMLGVPEARRERSA